MQTQPPMASFMSLSFAVYSRHLNSCVYKCQYRVNVWYICRGFIKLMHFMLYEVY